MAVLIVSGIAFVLVQGALGYFVARYGENGNERAAYWHDNPKAEAFLLIGTAVIPAVLLLIGQRGWGCTYFVGVAYKAALIQIPCGQIQWNFLLASRCGQFGRQE